MDSLLTNLTSDVTVVFDLELNYSPKVFLTSVDSMQMTLNMVKDNVYYSAYVNDWSAINRLYSLKKGSKISMAGSFKAVQKKNANGCTKFTIKLDPKTVMVDVEVLKIDPAANNDGTSRVVLLVEHIYVDHSNADKVSTSVTAGDILGEMQNLLEDANEEGALDVAALRQKKAKVEQKLAASNSKKRKVDTSNAGVFSLLKKSKQ